MRAVGPASALLALTCGLCGCSDSAPSPELLDRASSAAPSPAAVIALPGRLRINEAMVLGTVDLGDPTFEGALELINSGIGPIELSDYSIRTDDTDWRLPTGALPPGSVFVARALQPIESVASSFLSHPVRSLLLLGSDGGIVDELDVPPSVGGGVLARFPNGDGGVYVYPYDRASLGEANVDLGFVRQLAAKTEFSPRDSSPNAIVTFDGHHWVLGGWSHFGGDDWHSRADVWKSRDGVRWELVNSQPPYSHYSSFVAWNNRIWVIGPNSFSSTDGVEWQPEAIASPSLNKSVVFQDALFNVDGATVRVTRDGQHWTTLTETAPWTGARRQPMVVVFDDRIWVMGGVENYGTPSETLFNDVWASSDGVSWNLANPYADWSPRLWASAMAYDGKLFVIGGWNATEWPEQYGNSSEIWFTENGVEWLPLASELRWGSRHASLTTMDSENGLLVIAGYGHGGLERMYNDVWSLRVSMFFAKPEGDVRALTTWGSRMDGSGRAPESFDAAGQLFVLRNRDSFEIDESWAVTGAGSRIVVGDGRRDRAVVLHVVNSAAPQHPLLLLSNSTTFAEGCSPTVFLRDPQASFIDASEACAVADAD